jgi:hypothetical protein
MSMTNPRLQFSFDEPVKLVVMKDGKVVFESENVAPYGILDGGRLIVYASTPEPKDETVGE